MRNVLVVVTVQHDNQSVEPRTDHICVISVSNMFCTFIGSQYLRLCFSVSVSLPLNTFTYHHSKGKELGHGELNDIDESQRRKDVLGVQSVSKQDMNHKDDGCHRNVGGEVDCFVQSSELAGLFDFRHFLFPYCLDFAIEPIFPSVHLHDTDASHGLRQQRNPLVGAGSHLRPKASKLLPQHELTGHEGEQDHIACCKGRPECQDPDQQDNCGFNRGPEEVAAKQRREQEPFDVVRG